MRTGAVGGMAVASAGAVVGGVAVGVSGRVSDQVSSRVADGVSGGTVGGVAGGTAGGVTAGVAGQISGALASGYTLIEVLVAVLVVAIGIIGAAGSQLAAMRTRHGTALMSDAVQLAASLADRMRANHGLTPGADAANPYLGMHYNADDGAPSAPSALCYRGTNCASAELAAFDLYEVAQALQSGFPGGRIAVCRDAKVWVADAAALRWDCSGAAADPVVIKLGWRARRADGAADADAGTIAAPALAFVLPQEAA